MTKRQRPADRWGDEDVLETFKKPDYELLAVSLGMTITHTASSTTGKVTSFNPGDSVALVDQFGTRHIFKTYDGAFKHEGVRVALRAGEKPKPKTRITASGSVAVENQRAQVAKASRIWVEGIHDAELIEKIWGDDLRVEGIVVEPLHGADDLAAAVAEFAPGPGRRLGILLDHLVDGSKESRIAATVSHDAVLICGHPYVDIWEAIKPSAIGIDAWPTVPHGTPWKEGVVEALGLRVKPGVFWGKVLAATSSYLDVETPLMNAVEQLIDFVTEPAD